MLNPPRFPANNAIAFEDPLDGLGLGERNSLVTELLRKGQLDDYFIVEQLVALVQYKPGFTISVRPPRAGDYGVGAVVLSANVPDSRNPLEVVAIGRSCQVSPHLIEVCRRKGGAKEFYRWLFGEILSFERHEAQEWYKVNGELFDDPHATDPATAKD